MSVFINQKDISENIFEDTEWIFYFVSAII